MNTVEILRKARALIVERGWTQGRLEDDQGRLCAIGGLMRTGCDCSEGLIAIGCLEDVIGGGGVAGWNDSFYREKDEVLAAFTRAILHEEAKAAALAPVAERVEQAEPARAWVAS